jgi:phage terminase large subunit GpA-like protein
MAKAPTQRRKIHPQEHQSGGLLVEDPPSEEGDGLSHILVDGDRWILPEHFEALLPARRVSVSQWAAENRNLDPISANEAGRWRNEKTPYLVEPMDCMSDREVETVILQFPAQVGKTEAMLNFVGWAVDVDPGPLLYVYPRQDDADKVIKNRLQPLLFDSPALQRHLTGDPNDLGLKEIRLDRMRIFAAWSNSPAALAQQPCRYVICDEVNKYPPFAGREANPLKLAEIRTRTYRGRRKMIICSTPTTPEGYITQELERSDFRQYYVPCLHCGEYQVLDFWKGVKFPKGATGYAVKTEQSAWYECVKCSGRIVEDQRLDLVAKGKWVPKGMAIDKEGKLSGIRPSPRRAGFQMSTLPSPWDTFSDTAAEWLDAMGDHGRTMHFWNSWLAEPWRDKAETVKAVHILARCKGYRSGTAPAPAKRLTAFVDVQEEHFWYVLRAWGDREASWLVRYGQLLSWGEVEELIYSQSLIAGVPTRIERVLIDSGWNTDEVYRFCRKHYPLTIPSKGASGNTLLPLQTSKGDRIPVAHFKPDFWKDKLSRHILARDGEPGEWNVPSDVANDPTYLEQMTSQARSFKRLHGRTWATWESVAQKRPDHIWDCEVGNMVAARMIGVQFYGVVASGNAEKREAKPTTDEQQGQNGEPRRPLGGFLADLGDNGIADGSSMWED